MHHIHSLIIQHALMPRCIMHIVMHGLITRVNICSLIYHVLSLYLQHQPRAVNGIIKVTTYGRIKTLLNQGVPSARFLWDRCLFAQNSGKSQETPIGKDRYYGKDSTILYNNPGCLYTV